jgi:hypothetical protein
MHLAVLLLDPDGTLPAVTVAELIDLLAKYDSETPVEFLSTDGPDYGWLEVGPGLGPHLPMRDGTLSSTASALAQIGNDGVERFS